MQHKSSPSKILTISNEDDPQLPWDSKILAFSEMYLKCRAWWTEMRNPSPLRIKLFSSFLYKASRVFLRFKTRLKSTLKQQKRGHERKTECPKMRKQVYWPPWPLGALQFFDFWLSMVFSLKSFLSWKNTLRVNGQHNTNNMVPVNELYYQNDRPSLFEKCHFPQWCNS